MLVKERSLILVTTTDYGVYNFSAHMTLLYPTERYCYLLQEQLVHRPIWTVTHNGIPAEEDGA